MRGVATLALLVMGCSKDPEPFTVDVRGPLGAKPFAAPVARVELRVRGADGVEKLVSRVEPDGQKLEVPDAAKSGIGSLVLAGLTDTGAVIEYGRTPSLELEGLSGRATIALSLFVQRTSTLGEVVELAGPVATPRCLAIGTRYAVIADATATTADVVDLLDLSVSREPAFGRKPATVATAGAQTLIIDDTGAAELIDLEAGTTATPLGPFAEVNGGAAIADDKGGVWIVGATRRTTPTDVVIRLAPDGTIATRKLLRPRASAGAVYLPGRGLLVAYGTSPSMDEAGAELLAPDGESFQPLAFPADHKPAGVLARRDGAKVLRIDEDGVGTTLDVACPSACVADPSAIKDEKRAPRADDHVTPLEGGSALIVRGGRILLLANDKLTLLHDGGASPTCSVALSTGNAAVMIGGERRLRTVAPPRT